MRPAPSPKGISIPAARLTAGTSAAVLVLFVVVHLIKPELDPTWRMMSEYSIGHFGWVMVTTFTIWAVSCIALFVTIKSQIVTTSGKIGLGFLLITALGLLMAATFTMDPLTVPVGQSGHGKLHTLAATLCIPGLAIAALLINLSLLRNALWAKSGRWPLLITGSLPWTSMVLLFLTMGIALSRNQYKFGPEVPIGIPNRVMVVAFVAWMLFTALLAVRIQRSSTIS